MAGGRVPRRSPLELGLLEFLYVAFWRWVTLSRPQATADGFYVVLLFAAYGARSLSAGILPSRGRYWLTPGQYLSLVAACDAWRCW